MKEKTQKTKKTKKTTKNNKKTEKTTKTTTKTTRRRSDSGKYKDKDTEEAKLLGYPIRVYRYAPFVYAHF